MANEEQAAEPAMLLLKLLGEGSSAAARVVAPVLQDLLGKGGKVGWTLTKELGKAGLNLGVKGAQHAMEHVVSMGDHGVVSASKLESIARECGANITEVTLPKSLNKQQLTKLNHTLMKEKVACRVLSCDPPAIRCLEKDAGFVHRAAMRIQAAEKLQQDVASPKTKQLANGEGKTPSLEPAAKHAQDKAKLEQPAEKTQKASAPKKAKLKAKNPKQQDGLLSNYGVVSAGKLDNIAKKSGAKIKELPLPANLNKKQLTELNVTLMKNRVPARVVSSDPPAIRCLEKDAALVHRAAKRIQDKAKIKQPAALCKCKHLAKKAPRLKAKALPKPKVKMPSLKLK